MQTGPDAPADDLTGLARIGRRSLQERVYDELARQLCHGRFEAGQVLKMQGLADRMGVSIMPVREALARLISENALETLPSRSVRVPLITEARLTDLARARTLIESELVRMAARHLDTTTLAELKRLTETCEAAFAGFDPERPAITSQLNYDFHFAVYRAAGSAVLLPVVQSLWLQSGPYVRAAAAIYGENPGLTAVHHHWGLIAALEARDELAAMAALAADISQSFTLIRSQLRREDTTHG